MVRVTRYARFYSGAAFSVINHFSLLVTQVLEIVKYAQQKQLK
jgi:hypothetical protein